MDTSQMSHEQRQQRMNIRNFFLAATVTELENEIDRRQAEHKLIGGVHSVASLHYYRIREFCIECLEELKAEKNRE